MLRVVVVSGLGLLLVLAAVPWAGAIDRGADGNFDQRRSVHFRLLQDVDIDKVTGPAGSRNFERSVLEILEEAYETVRKTLDIRPRRDTDVVIYDPGVFDHTYSKQFRFRAAGFYDGIIHVRGDNKVHRKLIRTLHHEYFHAAIDSAISGSRIPGWLNEGLAEYFESLAVGKRHLSGGEAAYLSNAVRMGGWIPLSVLSRPSFAGLEEGAASVAYLQSYAVIDFLVREHGERRLRSFMRQVIRGNNLNKALKREFRMEVDELDAAVKKAYR